MLFSKRIKELREEKEISQKQLANAMHISQSSISEHESGNQQPSLEMLAQIADYFDVNTDYLLGRTDIKISIDNLRKSLSSNSGDITVNDFLRLKEDEKEAIGGIIKSFNKYNSIS